MTSNQFQFYSDGKKLLRFGLTGGFVFLVDYAVLWLGQGFLPPVPAVSLAYLTAVSVHFLLSRHWVFNNCQAALGRQLVRYVLCVALCWLSTVTVFSLCQAYVTANLYLAKAITIPPTTALGFILMRRLVFPSQLHAPRSES